MLRHYLEMKSQHPDAVVLYRMGDFYEVFFDDAARVAPILEVTLTARNKGGDNEVAMCGVPYHALEVYLAKLVRAGVKAAICEQMEDPKQAKGLVRREVTRVVTPGTLSEPELLDSKVSNYLASIMWNGDTGAGAFLDVSTGHFQVRRWETGEQAVDDLSLRRPAEVLFEERALPDGVQRWVDDAPCRTPVDGDRGAPGTRHARRPRVHCRPPVTSMLLPAQVDLDAAVARAVLGGVVRRHRAGVAVARGLDARRVDAGGDR